MVRVSRALCITAVVLAGHLAGVGISAAQSPAASGAAPPPSASPPPTLASPQGHVRPEPVPTVTGIAMDEGSAGPPLSLAEAVRRALAGNPAVAARRAEVVAARAKPDTLRALPPPMLEAQAWQWPRNTINPANVQWMAMLQQELPGRGKRALRVAVAEHEIEMFEGEAALEAVRVAGEIGRAYVDLWQARATLVVYAERVRLLRQVADAAEAKYAAGKAGQQDIVRALVEISRVHEQAVMARERARMAVAALNSLMGRQPDQPVGEVTLPEPPSAVPAASALMDIARQRHPEVALVEHARLASVTEVAVMESERKPDFVVQGGYMWMPDMPDAFTARVGISWPEAPWSRKGIEARVREAGARGAALEARRLSVENTLARMIEEARVRAASARERSDLLAGSLLPQAVHALELSRAEYQTDRTSFLELVDAERMVLDMRLDALVARADEARALIDLDTATGTLPAPLPELQP